MVAVAAVPRIYERHPVVARVPSLPGFWSPVVAEVPEEVAERRSALAVEVVPPMGVRAEAPIMQRAVRAEPTVVAVLVGREQGGASPGGMEPWVLVAELFREFSMALVAVVAVACMVVVAAGLTGEPRVAVVAAAVRVIRAVR